MKRQIALIVWFLLASHVTLTQALEWDDPTITDLGAEPPRASFVLHTDIAGALSYDDQASPYVKSLNGTWKFNWSRKPADRPVDFYQRDYDVTGWDDIQVPGDWQFQGYGVPYYANINYPFEADFPMAPKDYNPVGSYVRTFEVPADCRASRSFYISVESRPRSTAGSTANPWVIAKTARPRPNSISLNSYSPGPIPWPWRSTAGVTVAIWRIRTCGVSPGLSEMSPSWLPTRDHP